MEECWKYIKPFKYPLKGSYNNIGYGYRNKTRSKYKKRNIRKSYRDFRKYGFDTSETWSLDYTIMCWLSDNIGGFFRNCGSVDDWADCDLNGIEYDKSTREAINTAYKTRCESFLKHLTELLEYAGPETFEKFTNFVIPRLDFLSKYTHGYPSKYSNIESWREIIQEMIRAFKYGTYSRFFIEEFFALWD
jgi:hypothetical protein